MAESIIAGRLEEALYQTCLLLIEGRTDVLENTWISAFSRLGDVSEKSNMMTWYSICKDIWAICNADGLRVKDALLVTGKLTLLARQLSNTGAGLGGIGSTSVVRLRSLVIGLFPENGVRLTQRGQEMFARILPAREDERVFAERLLIGLTQLWDETFSSEKASLDLRLAIEYLLRKRQIGLHCARVGQHDSATPMWPYPSLEESDKGDIVWFLWGAWMAKYEWAELLWLVFSFNYKRGLRTARLGIMMGCIGMLRLPQHISILGNIWGQHERDALAYIDANSSKMWKEALEAAGEKTKPCKKKQMQNYETSLWNWTPRTPTQAVKHLYKKPPAPPQEQDEDEDDDKVSKWLDGTFGL